MKVEITLINGLGEEAVHLRNNIGDENFVNIRILYGIEHAISIDDLKTALRKISTK